MSGNLYRDIDKSNESLKDRIKRRWETSLIHDFLVDPIKRANALTKVPKIIKKLDVNAPNAKELLEKIDKVIYGYDLHTDQFGPSLDDEILDMWKEKKAAIEKREKESKGEKTGKEKPSEAIENENSVVEIEKE